MAVTDPHLHVSFFNEPKLDPRATREQGRPIYRDRELVRIKFVGDKKRELVARANEKFLLPEGKGEHITYAERFPEHYAAFKANAAAHEAGTPLAMLVFLRPTRLKELEAANVHTVEALAAIADRDLSKLGPATRSEREQAQDWLSRVEDGAATNRLADENAALKARLEALEARMTAAPTATASAGGDPFDAMSDDGLRAFLTERGAAPRANAARDKMIEAARQMADA